MAASVRSWYGNDVPHRAETPRSYLMCPPEYFEVSYAINPWMRPDSPVDADLAMRQWSALRATHESLGHSVSTIEPVAGLPDMVFAANGATVIDGIVLGVRFRHPERAAEAARLPVLVPLARVPPCTRHGR